ncbi:MAG: 16S rRNA (guanine(527)-N(7))-methyltransferase RsmG [Pseudomonadota bacterium]
MSEPDRKQLEDGLAALGIAGGEDLAGRLLDFVGLLSKWNRVYNLTAVRDPAKMVPLHLLDSLSVHPWLRGGRVVDVGTGAGLPGIPLALCDASRHFTLLDTNGKKTRFVTHAVGALGLGSVEVVQSRAEDYAPAEPFDTVVCRAYAPLARIVATSGHLCAKGGSIVAMKGARPDEELAELAEQAPDWRVDEVQRIVVPGLDSERHLVRLVKA